ncbi:MAG: primosomal protein DnaI [Bacilli bacterium]
MKNINEQYSSFKTTNLEKVLMKSFLDSLKDEDFKNFIDKLGLSYEVLSKYTSSLETSTKEYKNCCKCKGLVECKNNMIGYAYLPKVNSSNIIFQYKACKYQNKYLKELDYLKNIYNFNIPNSIKEAKMKDIYMDDENRYQVLKYLNHFIRNYGIEKNIKGIYLYGSFGCGKTYLVSSLFHELAKKNIKSAIVFWPDFLSELKSSFGGDKNEFKIKFEKIKKVPLLLIDDLGAENTTAFGRDEVLCPILQYRMQEALPTFFTSNLDFKMLEQHFSVTKDGVDNIKARRIIERINQLTEKIDLISENLRK